MTPHTILDHTIRFPYSGLTMFNRPRIVYLLNIFQDMASEHAARLNISGVDLAKQNYKWVITRYRIFFLRSIAWLEPVRVQTWRTPHKNLYEIRQFRIYDSDQNPVVTATGEWVMINSHTQKPVRLDRFLPGELLNTDPPGPLPFQEIILPDTFDRQAEFTVRFQDMDLNHHTNNGVYAGWAVETVPLAFLQRYACRSLDISFHQESVLGQEVSCFTRILEKDQRAETIHKIIRKRDHTLLSRLRIIWEPAAGKGEPLLPND